MARSREINQEIKRLQKLKDARKLKMVSSVKELFK
jgi:hypothetical protein